MSVSVPSPQPATAGANGSHDHAHDAHGHVHHHPAPHRAAAQTAEIALPFSLIRASLSLRVAGALVLSSLIWLAVYLVLAVPA